MARLACKMILSYKVYQCLRKYPPHGDAFAKDTLSKLSHNFASDDIDKMHTSFDQLIATLKAAKEEQSTKTQLLYLMKAYLNLLPTKRCQDGVREHVWGPT